MLNIFLSGHTKGVGQAIYSFYRQQEEVEIVGGSRQNGFDISTPEGRTKVVEACEKSNVIILNAHSHFDQVFLLYDLFDRYREEDKRLIVMGSDSSQGIKKFPHLYAIEKKAVAAACEQLQACHSRLSLSLISPGWIATKRIQESTNEAQISLEDMTSAVHALICDPLMRQCPSLSLKAHEVFDPDRVVPTPWVPVKN